MSIAAQAAQRQLIALISDEDTATGLLLAGIGHISNAPVGGASSSANANSNANNSNSHSNNSQQPTSSSIEASHTKNFFIANNQTSASDLEGVFHVYTQARSDIAILLINQHLAEKIRPLVDKYAQPFPALLEIPSKDHPYDPSKDSVLKRVQKLFGE